MADNVPFTPGSGGTAAADDIGGVHYQRVKISVGADGSATDMVGGAGAASAATPRVTLASDDPAVVALQAIDDWDEADRAKVNLIVGQAGVAAGAGAVGATTPRVTLASDDPAVTALAAQNYIEDAPSAAAPKGGVQILVRADALSAVTSDDDDNVAQRGTNLGEAYVSDFTARASLSIMDDWDESDRAKVNPIAGQAGVAAGAGAVGATVQRMTLASDDPLVALVSASIGYNASVTLTRTADANPYTANDVIGAATGSTAALTFASMGPSAGRVTITSVSLEIDASAIISGETSYLLHLFDVTPPSALGDNAAFDLPSGDRTAYLGSINLGVPADLGSTLYVEQNGINKQIKLSGTSIFAYLVTVGAHTPTSARVYVIKMHTIGL